MTIFVVNLASLIYLTFSLSGRYIFKITLIIHSPQKLSDNLIF
jgi:hypothetical protein